MADEQSKPNPFEVFKSQFLRNAVPYSEYAYGMFHAFDLARRLRLPRISVMEFGVAGGNGLVAMEAHAIALEKLFGVEVDIYGFDTGKGLTPPQDYRDLPYVFDTGHYEMDVPKLQARLSRAQLILGDVATTTKNFLAEHDPAPIGYVSWDMDYHSSTADALMMFGDRAADRNFMPRIFMHFDDVVGDEQNAYNDFIGELAAIHEFNATNVHVKLGENRAFRGHLNNLRWHHESYIMHRFKHERYASYIFQARHLTTAQTALKG